MIGKSVPIWIKVSFPVAASLALFIFIIFGVHMPDVKKRLLEQKELQIKDIVESSFGVLTYNYSQYENGTLTEKQAKDNAAKTLAEMKFGSDFKDYLWITDYEPRMVMHPYRPDMNGKLLSNYKDPHGTKLFVNMVNVTKATGEGFTRYMWQNKDDTRVIIPKISFVKRFKPWKWIVGSGIYMQEIDREVAAQMNRLLFYTMSVFAFILLLSAYAIRSGIKTNKELAQSERELKELNEDLEQRVTERTHELEESIETLKKTQSQLIESEKMASLGHLVAGVAHEINTPVGIGVTAITNLEEKVKDIKASFAAGQIKKSELEAFLENAEESSGIIYTNLTRAANLVKSFKQVAVDQTSEMPREFNIKHYIGDILMSLRPKLKHTVHDIVIKAPEDLIITSYPGVYMQIFSNLIMNSIIHGFEGIEHGVITIEVKQSEGSLTLIYSDNGKGMSHDQLARIYEPFYTTKRNTGGSGLGMNIVYNLVTRALGGTIFVSSEQNKGTMFIITVPLEQKYNDKQQ